MTEGVFDLNSKTRMDVEPDYAAIAAEMQHLIDTFTK
jgi:hypothetical protein